MSNKSVPIGPGPGGLYAGLAWGTAQGSQDAAHELASELAETKAKLLRALAAREGAQAVTNGIIDELTAEEAGGKDVRRLSDPKNRDARIQYREDAEEDALRRLSGGTLRMKRTTSRGK